MRKLFGGNHSGVNIDPNLVLIEVTIDLRVPLSTPFMVKTIFFSNRLPGWSPMHHSRFGDGTPWQTGQSDSYGYLSSSNLIWLASY
ncbi:MAG: hypothetical protein HKN76_21280 [Saprospiraceae bacterium]|nr:hypothetical protein [Saprospiraceae bacterium]